MAALDNLTATITALLDITIGTDADFADPVQEIKEIVDASFTVGTGADQANQVWSDQRTLAASANEELDIQGGTLENGFGQAITFSAIKAIFIRNRSTTGELLVGGAAANAFDSPFGDSSDKVRVRRGGILLLTGPDAVGHAVDASDVLKIDNEDTVNTLTYDIILVGED